MFHSIISSVKVDLSSDLRLKIQGVKQPGRRWVTDHSSLLCSVIRASTIQRVGNEVLQPRDEDSLPYRLNIIMEKFLSDEQIANMLDHWDSEDDLDLAALTNFESEYEDSASEHSSHRSDTEMELDSYDESNASYCQNK
ncbi:hypothetical protein EVAR_74960_1 [Eumeta japonica]|uniref:Uncharacterized protein n=1 Tax=Eumeta variegata TaxID=151549 RepID=A0A4C1UIF1_EUMVA|nr:hypothetical protein EVAR_74960_1 [Eumeta japonica]